MADFIRQHGASFFDEIAEHVGMLPVEVEDALAELVALGMVNSDSFAGLRVLLLPSGRRGRATSYTARRKRRLALFGMADAGRWALVRRPAAAAPERDDEAVEHIVRTLLRRWGVIFWKLLGREANWLPPWRDLLMCCRRLEARGEIRGGRFVAGFSGEQYATPEAVGLLRDVRRKPPARPVRVGVGRGSAESARHHYAGRKAGVARRQSAAVSGRLAHCDVCGGRSSFSGRSSGEGAVGGANGAVAPSRCGPAGRLGPNGLLAWKRAPSMEASRRRQGGRGRRIETSRVPQLPWADVANPYPPMEVLSADQLEAIHLTSLRILEELGMEVMSIRALSILEKGGAKVDAATRTVRLDRGLVASALKSAPASFALTPRNPAKRVILGGNHINFGLVAGPPNVHDCERGRRAGNLRDYCDFIRLAQYFNAIHLIGNQVCAPVDLPANSRHLDTYRANLEYSDKVFHCTAIGAGRALDGIRMMAIARGLDLRADRREPRGHHHHLGEQSAPLR